MTTKSFQIKSIFFILLLLATTCFNSCSKDSDEGGTPVVDNKDTRLIGTWRFTEVLSSGGFTVVTDYFIEFKTNGEANEWFGTSSNPVNNLNTVGWYTKGSNVVFINLQTKVENSVPFSMSTDSNTMLFNGNNTQVYQKIK